jgi:hypothetical protein
MNLQEIINDSLTVFLVLLHDVHEHNAVESQELRQFLTTHCERLRLSTPISPMTSVACAIIRYWHKHLKALACHESHSFMTTPEKYKQARFRAYLL